MALEETNTLYHKIYNDYRYWTIVLAFILNFFVNLILTVGCIKIPLTFIVAGAVSGTLGFVTANFLTR